MSSWTSRLLLACAGAREARSRLQAVGDVVERVGDGRLQELEGHDHQDGDEGQDEGILDHALALLGALAQLGDARLRRHDHLHHVLVHCFLLRCYCWLAIHPASMPYAVHPCLCTSTSISPVPGPSQPPKRGSIARRKDSPRLTARLARSPFWAIARYLCGRLL